MKLTEEGLFENLINSEDDERKNIALIIKKWKAGEVYEFKNISNKYCIVSHLPTCSVYYSLEMANMGTYFQLIEVIATRFPNSNNRNSELDTFNTYRYELLGNKVVNVSLSNLINKSYDRNFQGLLAEETLHSFFQIEEKNLECNIVFLLTQIDKELTENSKDETDKILSNLREQSENIT